jgi:hypothetical protein
MSGEKQKPYADLLYVGASLLAMDVNDNACCLEKALPSNSSRASSLLQGKCVRSVGAAEGCDLLILMSL